METRRNFYGRRFGKTLRDSQKGYLAEDLGRFALPGVSLTDNPERRPLSRDALPEGELWLEVGFGGGEHLVAMAKANPGVTIIGAEPFINGVAMLLGKIRAAGVENLRLYPADVRDLFDVCPEGVFSRAFLNYPDPWPKARHHRRRFVTQDHLQPLRRTLVPGARFHVATDIPDYMRQTLEEVPKAGFTLMSHGPDPWADWHSTRYEQKALREGRTPDYAVFAAS